MKIESTDFHWFYILNSTLRVLAKSNLTILYILIKIKLTILHKRLKNKVFKRKIYNSLLDWKKTSKGKTALLIEGPRRVGKSTVVETFAKNEYESYILIDFYKASKETKALFS